MEAKILLFSIDQILGYYSWLMKKLTFIRENLRLGQKQMFILSHIVCINGIFSVLISFFSAISFSAEFIPKNSTLKCQELFTSESRVEPRNEEFAFMLERQELRFILEFNLFEDSRGINDYAMYFGDRFVNILNHLQLQSSRGSANPHWFDSGTSEALAMADLLEPVLFKNSIHLFPVIDFDLTALSYARADFGYGIESLKSRLGHRFQYLAGKYFEDYQKGEIRLANLITDVYGPFSYSMAPDLVLKKYLDLLHPKGSLFLLVNKNTSIMGMSLTDYFSSIGGVEIHYPYSDIAKAPFNEAVLFTVQIIKKSPNTSVPRLEAFRYNTGRPPIRGYRIVK